VKEPPIYLKQLEVGPMQNFIYLIGDPKKRECVMVDPAWDVDQVLRVAHADDMKVIGGLITHTHFDHCNGVEELLEKTKSKVYVHKNETKFLKGMQKDMVKVDSGFKLAVGDIVITFLHTPGHTPGSQCFLLQDRLVSGDTLFINACGRCDLSGGDATEMYESLQRLAKLDDSTILLPGHNYADRTTSTIGDEKRFNPYYQAHSLQDFLRLRMGY
jgi:glyoxylase-like metal-dependent hydrolase (beta-lactamase superfamily II)